MKHCTTLIGLLALSIAVVASAAQPRPAEPSAEVIARITAAAPDKATVQPARPRKVLVFNLCRGFYHDSIPVASKAMEILGQKTGAFTTVVSTDIAMFEPQTLAQFDAVILNNTTGEIFTPVLPPDATAEQRTEAENQELRLKKSLVDFVSGGKGLVGIHAATDCLYKWDEYGRMMGGYFWGHPWNEQVGVKIDDPDHPINAAFKGQGFMVADEIYQFRDPYSREELRVLLSLDVSRTNMTRQGINRKDNDFAVSWVRSYGQGRVFYCSLGHRHDIFWTPALLQHYLDGIQFALGDLKADTTPSAKLSRGK